MKESICRNLFFTSRAPARLLVILSIVSSVPCLSAQFMSLPVDLSYLARRADVIVQGKVIDVRHESLPGYRNIPTVSVTLEVENMLRGPSGGTYTFREAYIGLRSRMGKQNYRVGQRLFLFLPSPSQYGLSSPVGTEQGRFHIARNAVGREVIANEVENVGLFKNVEQDASRAGKKLAPAQLRTISTRRGPVRLDEFISLTRSLISLPRIR